MDEERASKRQRQGKKLHDARLWEKLGKPYLAAGTPSSLVRWLVNNKALGMLSQLEANGEGIEEETLDSQAVGAYGQAGNNVDHNMAFNHQMDIDPEDIQLDIPCAFTAENAGVGANLRKLPLAMGSRVTDILKVKLKGVITEARGKLQAGDRADNAYVSHVRMPAKGGKSDSLEHVAWTPTSWREVNLFPEGLRDDGAPWLFCGHPGSTRSKNNSWPLPGHGQFLAVTEGAAILVAIPYESICARGASHEAGMEWLCHDLSYGIFDKTVTEAGRAVTLTVGCTAWVPFWVGGLAGQLGLDTKLHIRHQRACGMFRRVLAVLGHREVGGQLVEHREQETAVDVGSHQSEDEYVLRIAQGVDGRRSASAA